MAECTVSSSRAKHRQSSLPQSLWVVFSLVCGLRDSHDDCGHSGVLIGGPTGRASLSWRLKGAWAERAGPEGMVAIMQIPVQVHQQGSPVQPPSPRRHRPAQQPAGCSAHPTPPHPSCPPLLTPAALCCSARPSPAQIDLLLSCWSAEQREQRRGLRVFHAREQDEPSRTTSTNTVRRRGTEELTAEGGHPGRKSSAACCGAAAAADPYASPNTRRSQPWGPGPVSTTGRAGGGGGGAESGRQQSAGEHSGVRCAGGAATRWVAAGR